MSNTKIELNEINIINEVNKLLSITAPLGIGLSSKAFRLLGKTVFINEKPPVNIRYYEGIGCFQIRWLPSNMMLKGDLIQIKIYSQITNKLVINALLKSFDDYK